MSQFIYNNTIKKFCVSFESDYEVEQTLNSIIFLNVEGETVHFETYDVEDEKSLREKYLNEKYIEEDYCVWGNKI